MLGVEQRRVIEILTGKKFAGAREVVLRQTKVLAVDQIDRDRRAAVIAQVEVPEPSRRIKCQT